MPEAPHRNMTSFFLPIDTEGVEVQEPYKDAGRMALSTGGFTMEDVRLPDEYRLGEVGRGFYYTMEGFDNARMMIGASCVGIIQRLIDEAVPYIKERKTFGRPLAKYEAIQFELAELYREMKALKLMTRKTTWMQDIRYREEGMPEKTSGAKTFKPTEVAKWISMIKWKGPSLALEAERERALSTWRRLRNTPKLCSGPGQRMIQQDIQQDRLDRIVVASCSPRMHEQTFRTTIAEVGLNPHLSKSLVYGSNARGAILAPLKKPRKNRKNLLKWSLHASSFWNH